MSASVLWRYVGARVWLYRFGNFTNTPSLNFGAKNYIDLSAYLCLTPGRGGIRNPFDQNPPLTDNNIAPASVINTNTFPLLRYAGPPDLPVSPQRFPGGLKTGRRVAAVFFGDAPPTGEGGEEMRPGPPIFLEIDRRCAPAIWRTPSHHQALNSGYTDPVLFSLRSHWHEGRGRAEAALLTRARLAMALPDGAPLRRQAGVDQAGRLEEARHLTRL